MEAPLRRPCTYRTCFRLSQRSPDVAVRKACRISAWLEIFFSRRRFRRALLSCFVLERIEADRNAVMYREDTANTGPVEAEALAGFPVAVPPSRATPITSEINAVRNACLYGHPDILEIFLLLADKNE